MPISCLDKSIKQNDMFDVSTRNNYYNNEDCHIHSETDNDYSAEWDMDDMLFICCNDYDTTMILLSSPDEAQSIYDKSDY